MNVDIRPVVERFRDEIVEAVSRTEFVVFLCGPALAKANIDPSAASRKHLSERLEAERFTVVLGEDDGLENTRLQIGLNAQDNELEFIRRHCNAVIVLAASVGSFCELGLFSWHFAHRQGALNGNSNRTDFILLIDKKYQGCKSYLNEGPGAVVEVFGQVLYVDFTSFDAKPVVQRLVQRRAIFGSESRGRKRSSA